jgi:hypothetical protein
MEASVVEVVLATLLQDDGSLSRGEVLQRLLQLQLLPLILPCRVCCDGANHESRQRANQPRRNLCGSLHGGLHKSFTSREATDTCTQTEESGAGIETRNLWFGHFCFNSSTWL